MGSAGAVGEDQAVPRNGVGLASVAFDLLLKSTSWSGVKSISMKYRKRFMADAVVQLSGGQPTLAPCFRVGRKSSRNCFRGKEGIHDCRAHKRGYLFLSEFC